MVPDFVCALHDTKPRTEDWRALAGRPGSINQRGLATLAAATRHAVGGGPRGRALASTVAGANRQVTPGRGAIESSTGQKTDETVGGVRTKPGPATQNTQWLSPAELPGSLGCSVAAFSCRQSSKPPKSATPSPSARTLNTAPGNAKAMPCRNRTQMRRHAVRHRPLFHRCAFQFMPTPRWGELIDGVPGQAIEFCVGLTNWKGAVAHRPHSLQRPFMNSCTMRRTKLY